MTPNIIRDFVPEKEYPLFPMQYLRFNLETIPFTPTREEIIYIKRGMGYFVTPGAKKQILKVRRKEFMEQTMPELRRRMQLLGISIDDIVKEYEKLGSDCCE